MYICASLPVFVSVLTFAMFVVRIEKDLNVSFVFRSIICKTRLICFYCIHILLLSHGTTAVATSISLRCRRLMRNVQLKVLDQIARGDNAPRGQRAHGVHLFERLGSQQQGLEECQ